MGERCVRVRYGGMCARLTYVRCDLFLGILTVIIGGVVACNSWGVGLINRRVISQ